MVYCTKCGTQNDDNSKFCSTCGANLWGFEEREEDFGRRMEEWGEDLGRRMETWGDDFGKRMEKECFGIPHGAAIAGIVFGLLIIAIGLGVIFNFSINFGAYFVIILGILIIAGAVYKESRKS